MSSITFIDTVTHVPASWANDVNTLVYSIFNGSQTVEQAQIALGLGSMSQQQATSVIVSGGFIDAVTMGINTPIPLLQANSIRVLNAAASPTDVLNYGTYVNDVQTRVSDTIGFALNQLGSMIRQNSTLVDISGGNINGVTFGAEVPCEGIFTTLKVINQPQSQNDVVTLGWLNATYGTVIGTIGTMGKQSASAVNITGGSINGTSIGASVTNAGYFTTLRTSVAPVLPTDATNKSYVDTAIQNIVLGVGTIASQNANAVNITGGTIDSTTIGSMSVAPASVSTLDVKNNTTPYIRIKATSTAPYASYLFNNGSADVGSLNWYTATNPNTALQNTLGLTTTTSFNIFANSILSATFNSSGLQVAKLLTASNSVLGGAVTDTYHDLIAANNVLANGYNVAHSAITVSTNSTILDFSIAHSWTVNLSTSTTLTFNNQSTTSNNGFDQKISIKFIQTGAFVNAVNWPSNVTWISTSGSYPASAPNFSSGAVNGINVVELHSTDNGVTWIANSLGGTNSP